MTGISAPVANRTLGLSRASVFLFALVLLMLALLLAATPASAQNRVERSPVAATPAEPAEPRPGIEKPVPTAPGESASTLDPRGDPRGPALDPLEPGEVASADLYTPMKPTPGVGMPVPGGIDFQDQVSPTGQQAKWINNAILVPMMAVVSLFVLGLMLWVIARYRRAANPEPSRTTHNTTIEVIWTLVPVLILLVIAVPSISLLANQYRPAPEGALTIKVTGYQWYWGYSYPDNGGFEIISNMLDEDEANARGEPFQLAVDNRMVIPVGTPVKLLVTGADVIHSFAIPAAWFKLDAVPGRINEKVLQIDKVGVYYGQCSELCGPRHGFMPITVEVLPLDRYNDWVRAQGGVPQGEAEVQEVTAEGPETREETARVPGPQTVPAGGDADTAGNNNPDLVPARNTQ